MKDGGRGMCCITLTILKSKMCIDVLEIFHSHLPAFSLLKIPLETKENIHIQSRPYETSLYALESDYPTYFETKYKLQIQSCLYETSLDVEEICGPKNVHPTYFETRDNIRFQSRLYETSLDVEERCGLKRPILHISKREITYRFNLVYMKHHYILKKYVD